MVNFNDFLGANGKLFLVGGAGLIGIGMVAYIATVKKDDWDENTNSGNYSPNAIKLTHEPSLKGGSKRKSKTRRRR